MEECKTRILVVGQTPPPWHGQAVMIQKLLQGHFNKIELYHVRMNFSSEINQIGKINIWKITHVCEIIIKIIYSKFRYNITVLSYPPAGPRAVPILRDFVILFFTRWLFKYTVFHFYAGGLTESRWMKNSFTRMLLMIVYSKPDMTFRPSIESPEDRKSTRLNSSHYGRSRMPSSA